MIGTLNGSLDCPLLPLDAPGGFHLWGDEVAFDRPLKPGEVFGLVDLDALNGYLEEFSPVAPPSTDRVNEIT